MKGGWEDGWGSLRRSRGGREKPRARVKSRNSSWSTPAIVQGLCKEAEKGKRPPNAELNSGNLGNH